MKKNNISAKVKILSAQRCIFTYPEVEYLVIHTLFKVVHGTIGQGTELAIRTEIRSSLTAGIATLKTTYS